jgi:hypothetical protein
VGPRWGHARISANSENFFVRLNAAAVGGHDDKALQKFPRN